MARLSKRQLIHKADTQGGLDMAKLPGLVRRGNSFEIRVRVPGRLRPIILTREVKKSFGNVSEKEARRRWFEERALIEQRFEAAEIKLGLAPAREAIPSMATAPISDDQMVELAKKFLADLEASAYSMLNRPGIAGGHSV